MLIEKNFELVPFLTLMVEKGGSDLFFTSGAKINMKIQGSTKSISKEAIPSGYVMKLMQPILDNSQRKEFETNLELNFGLSIKDVGRFRVNLYRQRGEEAMVIRHNKDVIPTIQDLCLPHLLQNLILESRGLILVVGSTGSGKSTTLASMIDYRNSKMSGHILTIEDPIEFYHDHKKSIINQREVGIDTRCYGNALVNAMREAPDVIMIGEIRDVETMRHAMTYSETGHLCISTLHAKNANQALERIINMFPDQSKKQLLFDLSLDLKAIVSQRLIIGVDGNRVPACEILINTPYIADLIAKGEIEQIKEAMERDTEHGMQTFDESLRKLVTQNRISREEALKNADSQNNLSLLFRLNKNNLKDLGNNLTIDDS